MTIPDLRDLDEGELWCRHSLSLRDQRDDSGRARCLGQLARAPLRRENPFQPKLGSAARNAPGLRAAPQGWVQRSSRSSAFP
jgi:hypothetical protein